MVMKIIKLKESEDSHDFTIEFCINTSRHYLEASGLMHNFRNTIPLYRSSDWFYL